MDSQDSKKRKLIKKAEPEEAVEEVQTEKKKKKKKAKVEEKAVENVQKDKKSKKELVVEEEEQAVENVQLENKKKKKKAKVEEKAVEEENQEVEKVEKKKKKKAKVEENDDEEKQDEVKQTISLSPKEVAEYRETHNVSVSGSNSDNFAPFTTFEEASKHFSKEILSVTKGFTKPTPIQAQCWPVVLAKRDIVAIAETGSGKTLAFTLPGLLHISKTASSKKAPTILVLAPTRELAMQTADVAAAAGKSLKVNSVCIYGGVSKQPQKEALKNGVGIVIATPGRLLDLAEEGCVDFSQVNYLVLDEADRMLDMGFEKDIRAIISKVTNKRQTLMFSATWPQSIQALASEFLKNPVQVTIGSLDLSANHRVEQNVEVIDPFEKDKRLLQLLQQHHKSRKNRVLIFALYKKEAARIEATLRRGGWQVQAIHGDKSQANRTEVVNAFKDGSEPLLVATDVAARGLDIPDVEFVINYTFPLTIEDYVHRIGRTGRAGKKGVSFTFFTQHDKAHAGELVNVLNEANQKVPEDLLKFGTHVKKKEHALYGNHFKNVDLTKKATRVTFD